MEKKWNLQDIKPASPKRRTRTIERSTATASEERPDHDNEFNSKTESSSRKKKPFVLAAGAIVILAVVVWGLSFLLSGTEITTYPRHRELNVNATFTAYKTPQAGELSYELMSLEADGERQVTATGQEEAKEQATGEITIYNKTSKTERLIKNTRFESPDGLVFHITESAVVPAGKEGEDGETVPGTVTAKVFADAPGEEYNLQPTRFVVPGYRENDFTELYENIYAENKTAFSGGFNGTRFILDEAELKAAKETLHNELKEALLSRVDSEKPAGFVAFADAITFVYQSLPAVKHDNNMATIKEKAILKVPIFALNDFASYLAAATIPGYEQESVRIDDYSTLTFSYANSTSTDSIDLSGLESFDFKLTGKPLIVWTYDESKLKTDLQGAPKTALNTILGAYPAIEKAEAVVRPFWKRSFSANIDDITITETLE